ncbi:EamA family transporter RarD [Aestuariicoccus sp. MJ-SS9]|uniref:EamA family transporter RarD n=1 Tax=Aestuariicoccus sp. MJ-SS9 TaxID=3079855 RepID=UPI0029110CC9|nr:EamA family transporter RarD [Aestuariicoccus sp. MJ-SS9]MDU8912571.1 EamA family transporter RarD [Aestuariicoccus sp. MJ-SS9]
MQHPYTGLLALIGACTIWGLSPVFYKLLVHVPPSELLAHRTVWSLVIFTALLALQGRLGALRAALSRATVGRILTAALLVSCNWFLFIYAIQIDRTTEASLGYYIFPLVSVMLGVLVLGERLSRPQILAVGLAALAVLILSVGLGAPPWISLILATTFGLYGLIKKRLPVGPVVSVTAEVTMLSPIALAWLVWLHHAGGAGGVFGAGDPATSALLILSGLLTALPLILFSYASQRASMATVGLVQYLNPTLQFFCAVVLFGEPFGLLHAVTFGLIWTALAIYSAAHLGHDRARRRAAKASSTLPTEVTKPKSEASAKP